MWGRVRGEDKVKDSKQETIILVGAASNGRSCILNKLKKMDPELPIFKLHEQQKDLDPKIKSLVCNNFEDLI